MKQKQISLIKPDGSFVTGLAFDNRELLYLHVKMLTRFKDGDRIEIRELKNQIQGVK